MPFCITEMAAPATVVAQGALGSAAIRSAMRCIDARQSIDSPPQVLILGQVIRIEVVAEMLPTGRAAPRIIVLSRRPNRVQAVPAEYVSLLTGLPRIPERLEADLAGEERRQIVRVEEVV